MHFLDRRRKKRKRERENSGERELYNSIFFPSTNDGRKYGIKYGERIVNFYIAN